MDNKFKLVSPDYARGIFELYDLEKDPKQATNIFDKRPEIAGRMVKGVSEGLGKTGKNLGPYRCFQANHVPAGCHGQGAIALARDWRAGSDSSKC